MRQIKVLINCPGGWSHGLDSPERGEGRWAQNLVKVLLKSGQYVVHASSGGNPRWGEGEVVEGAVLLSEPMAQQLGPYDLYFDASWWEGKPPVAEARHHFHVHWGFEPRLLNPLPANHYLVYVYRQLRDVYIRPDNPNSGRTFYLPASFHDRLVPPSAGGHRLVRAQRDDARQPIVFDRLYAAVDALRAEFPELHMTWVGGPGYVGPRHPNDEVLVPSAAWGVPYCELFKKMQEATLNVPVAGVGSVPDCSVLGVPSLISEDGCDRFWGFVREVAERHGVLAPANCDSATLRDLLRRLLVDEELYVRYALDLQDTFRDHTAPRVLELFNDIVKAVL